MSDRSVERQTIIDATYRCLDRNEGATLAVGEILAEAKLSTRAFYRHFGSKDDLLLEMMRRDREIVLGELQEASARGDTASHALANWIDFTLGLVSDQRRKRRVMIFFSEELHRTRGYLNEIERFSRAEQAALAGIIHEGRVDGSFPDASPESDARFARAAIDAALLDQIHQTASVGPEETARQVRDFIFRALGAAPVS